MYTYTYIYREREIYTHILVCRIRAEARVREGLHDVGLVVLYGRFQISNNVYIKCNICIVLEKCKTNQMFIRSTDLLNVWGWGSGAPTVGFHNFNLRISI